MNILWILGNRTFSKESSVTSEDLNEDDDDVQTSSDDPSKKKKKRFHTPFVFKVLKFNGPEWHWILMGAICSLIYGATQPIFALFFSYVYGLFANPDLEEQKHLASVYSGVIFVIGFAGAVTLFLSTVGFAKSGEELTMRMRKLTFSAMLRQEMGYFDYETNSVGALVTRLSSDASALKVNSVIAKETLKDIFIGYDWCSYWNYTSSSRCFSDCSCYCIFSWVETSIYCTVFRSFNDV